MITWIAFGAAAVTAFFLNGCKEDASPPPPLPKDAGPDSSPLPPPLPRDARKNAKQGNGRSFAAIEETLKGHPRALKAYASLKEMGAKLEDLDHGCHWEMEIPWVKDFKIEPCEVYEYALDHYPVYPFAAREVVGGDLPWVLSTWNPFDRSENPYEEKLNKTLKALKNAPAMKDLDPESPLYKKKLARALFYFVNFPQRPQNALTHQKIWRERTRELTYLGLRDFQNFLFENGGFGAFDFIPGPGHQYSETALAALAKKRGGDYSKSNILYAVFKEAGLKPFFTRVQFRFANPHAEIEASTSWTGVTKFSDKYVAVGIPWKDSSLIFHVDEMWELDPDTPNQPFYSLREYLAYYIYTVGTFHMFTGHDNDIAIRHFNHSLEIAPKYSSPFNGLAITLENKGQIAESFKAIEEGLKVEGNDYFLNLKKAGHLKKYKQAKPEDLLKYYYRAIWDEVFPLMVQKNDKDTKGDLKEFETVANAVLAKDPENGMAQDILKALAGKKIHERVE